MDAQQLAMLGGGGALTLGTLADIFATILVPGPTRVGLSIGPRVGNTVRATIKLLTRGRGVTGNVAAPLTFLLIFVAWMALLLVGFGLLFLGVRDHFAPRLAGFDDALYFAGSSLLTLGVSEVDAHGPARWLLLAAGLSGFGVITATLSFVTQVQAALHQRESRVLALASLAGTPASGIAILEAVAALGVASELHDFFRTWRDWAAAMLHSHLASPMLIFLHSVDRESDWLRALEAVLDAATMLEALTQHEARGAATLMHRTGSRTVARLCALLRLEVPAPAPLPDEEFAALVERLRAAGYPVAEGGAAQFERLRGDYVSRIGTLAAETGA